MSRLAKSVEVKDLLRTTEKGNKFEEKDHT